MSSISVFLIVKNNEPKHETKQSQETFEHASVSVSIFSNIPKYKVKSKFLCPDKPTIPFDELLTLFLRYHYKQNLSINLNMLILLIFLDAYVVINIQNDLCDVS